MNEAVAGVRSTIDRFTGSPIAKARRKRLARFGYNLPQRPENEWDWQWSYSNEHLSSLSRNEFEFLCKALEVFGPPAEEKSENLIELKFFIQYHKMPLTRIQKIVSDFAPGSISLKAWNEMFYALQSLDEGRSSKKSSYHHLDEDVYQRGLNRALIYNGMPVAILGNSERLLNDRDILLEPLGDTPPQRVSVDNFQALISLYALPKFGLTEEESKRLAMLSARMGPKTLAHLTEAFPDDPNIAVYGESLGRTLASPSRQVRELMPDLLPTLLPQLEDDPSQYIKVLTQIERIFLRNHLPFVGKQYRIFSIMSGIFLSGRKYKNIASPELKKIKGESGVKLRLFKDLLQISLLSGEQSLVDFLKLLDKARTIISAQEEGRSLDEAESAILSDFLKRMEAIRINPEKAGSGLSSAGVTLEELRAEYGCKPGESLVDKIESLFLKKIGISGTSEALAVIRSKLKDIDAYNRDFVKKPEMKKGDMLKGVSSKFLYENLERGFFANEFIGTSHRSTDATPFDVDLGMLNSDGWGGTALELAKGYGNMILILKDRGQYAEKPTSSSQYERFALKLYKSKGHTGIRTGFASTEINGVIVKDSVNGINLVKDAIVRKGFYIPIFSLDKKLLFSPEEFDVLKKAYEQFERMGETQNREQLQDFLSNPDLTFEQIVEYGRNMFPEVFKKSVGVAEGYSYEEHVGYVLKQFERYGIKLLPEGAPQWLMRFFILYHDIGKPMGVEIAGSTTAQHNFTTELMGRFMQSAGFTPQERALLTALAEGDYVGEYIQGKVSFDEAVMRIKEGAIRGEVTPEYFFALLDAYYLSDAGSYTADAGAKPALDGLFEFDRKNGTADYASNVKAKIEDLRMAVSH